MKKKTAALLLIFAVFLIYLIFLFFFPSKYVNINNEIKIIKAFGNFLSQVPYLKAVSGLLINQYTLIAVFFFVLGFIYGKRSILIVGSFIVFSAIIYLLIIKVNDFLSFKYGLKEFLPLWFSLFAFFFFSQNKKERIGNIILFFVIFSFFYLLFFGSATISGILLAFLFSLFLGKIFQELTKLLF